MASNAQRRSVIDGGGAPSRQLTRKAVTLTMVAGATAKGTITVPAGSWLSGIRTENAAAFSGTPTNINLLCGTADGGAQVVASVDVKAAGHFLHTVVAAFDAVTGATTYYFQIAATGGTNPAGAVNCFVEYYPQVK